MILFRPKHQTLEPSDEDLRQWSQSEWPEYREWLERKNIQTRRDWMQQRDTSRKWKKRPIFSLITPVFDTDPGYLLECVLSVLVQSYEHWELCLVNDGSTRIETLEVLEWAKKRDRRIRVCTLRSNQGICAASNVAVKMAKGEYAAFLDHDDRLAPEALFYLARAVRDQPEMDVWYTDRDMISARNLKYMHLLKPSWSPETILSGNYCFHLMAYRLSFLLSLGSLRLDFEGSQDYDLILRAAEHTEKIAHLPRVLYHWRQAERSLALDDTSKEYTFSAGLQAVRESLSRRNIQAEVNEDPDLWRGHYRIRFLGGPDEEVRIVRVPMHKDPSGYAQEVLEALQKALDHGAHVAILGQGLEYPDESLNELNAWLVIPKVKLTTGKMVDSSSHIIHSGLVLRYDGSLLEAYRGFEENHAGYMAATAIVRNVTVPHPYCLTVHKDLVGTFMQSVNNFAGPWAVVDLALAAVQAGYRCVYNPMARFVCAEDPPSLVSEEPDLNLVQSRWKQTLVQGDPCYNPGLTLVRRDMSLMDAAEESQWQEVISTIEGE